MNDIARDPENASRGTVTYRGLRFRSDLTARWAVFFDVLSIPWCWQPQDLAASKPGHQPDFLLEGSFWISVEDDPGHLDTSPLLDTARELGFLMILGPVPEPRRNEYGYGDWGWSRVTDDPCWVNQYGFGTWYKDQRPWAHCDYVPPGPGWLRPVWCDSEANCADAYAAARSARFGYALAPLPASASPIERQFWDTHCRLGLPELKGLVPQYRADRFRLDFALPEHKIGIELDGLRNHSKVEDITRDRVRQRWLEELGWRITRFGGGEVHHDAESVVRQVARTVKRWTGS